MSTSDGDEIEQLRHRLSDLIGRADLGGDARELAAEALEELAVVIEEMQAQNAELEASRRALGEQTARYRNLYESVADGYLITDAEGIVGEANMSACEMFGEPRAALVGKPLSIFIAPDDRSAFYTQLDRVRNAGPGGHVTINLSVRDHETIPTSLRATHVGPQDGKSATITWLLRDRRHDLVTEELRSSEERLRSLFDTAQVGVILCDIAGEIVFSNRYADHALDRRRGETAFADRLSAIHPDDRPAVEGAIRAAAHTGTSASLRYRVIHKDADTDTEEHVSRDDIMWLDHSVLPYHEDGEVTGTVSTLVDVTTEVSAMTDLSNSRDFTEALLDTAGALVVVIDTAGRVLRFNKACEEATGFAASEIVGRRLVDCLIPPERRTAASIRLAEIQAADGAERTGTVESDWVTADGGRRRVSWTYTSLTDPTGEVTATIATGVDITEQRLLESRLAQNERLEAIGRLTSGVAHDFNNTLTTLRLRLERLGSRHADPESREDLAAAATTIDRTQQLIGDLLSFSRRGASAPVRLDVNAEIHRVTGILRELFRDDISIELDLCDDPEAVVIDPARFEQALTNLAINAHDAMGGGGTLTLTTAIETIRPNAPVDARVPGQLPPGRYVVLSVADTGAGIDPEHLPHVFDPYFTTKPPGRGTGLGLATTYGTITQSGGAILVDSRPGRGTAFHIWLPLESGTTDGVPRFASESGTAAGMTVLVVDDDDDLRHVLVDELTALGHRTLEAPDAATALEYVDEPISLLVCDVQLPDLNGHGVSTRLLSRHPDMRVVYISGAPADDLRRVLPPEVSVLPKPFTIEDLLDAIDGAT